MVARRHVIEKRCTRCKEVKPRQSFHTSRTDASGLQSWCMDCQSIGRREYVARHPDRIKAINQRTQKRLGKQYYREQHQNLKRAMVNAYGGSCECCGEPEIEFLSLDHVEGRGGEHRKAAGGGTKIWRQLRDSGWPKTCEYGRLRILCLNCQGATRNGKSCPHELQRQAARAPLPFIA